MPRSTVINTSFLIVGFDMLPEELSQLLGTDPDETGLAGEVRHRSAGVGSVTLKDNYWEVRGPEVDSYMIEDHLRPLLAKVETFADRLAQLPETVLRRFDVAVTLHPGDSKPGLRLDVDLSRHLAALNAELEVDIN